METTHQRAPLDPLSNNHCIRRREDAEASATRGTVRISGFGLLLAALAHLRSESVFGFWPSGLSFSPAYVGRYRLCLFALVLLVSIAPARGGGVVSAQTEAALLSALAGGGEVTFTNNSTIIISKQIRINQAATTINANGHTVVIGGSNAVPLFDVVTNLTLRGLSLANGKSLIAGGALFIRTGVVVTANGCVFAGNSAAGADGLSGVNGATNGFSRGENGASGTQGRPALGGAIYNLGSLSLVNCTLTNNSVSGGTGGAGGSGGPGGGTLTIGGSGGDGAVGGLGRGGAVYNLGNLTLVNCTFSANIATGGNGGAGGAAGSGTTSGMPGTGGPGSSGSGGAVFNARNLSVVASTFSANSSRGGNSATAGQNGNGTGSTGIQGGAATGGAVHNDWWAAATNCTFYSNTVLGGTGGNGGDGGGLFAVPGDGGTGGTGIGGALDNANKITLVNCTFSSNGAFGGTNGLPGSGNSTAENGRTGEAQGGNIANTGRDLTLMTSILTASQSGGNSFGPLTDAGYNLSSDSVSSFGSSSFQNTNPKLSLPAANGGPTLTMALRTGSLAIDYIPADATPPTDQRGFSRPVNERGDIGAFELGAAQTAGKITLSINKTTNKAIQLSGTGTSGAAYIIESSSNLATWQAVATNTGSIQFIDSITNSSSRFYRISR